MKKILLMIEILSLALSLQVAYAGSTASICDENALSVCQKISQLSSVGGVRCVRAICGHYFSNNAIPVCMKLAEWSSYGAVNCIKNIADKEYSEPEAASCKKLASWSSYGAVECVDSLGQRSTLNASGNNAGFFSCIRKNGLTLSGNINSKDKVSNIKMNSAMDNSTKYMTLKSASISQTNFNLNFEDKNSEEEIPLYQIQTQKKRDGIYFGTLVESAGEAIPSREPIYCTIHFASAK